jgi:hypothetical protein
MKIFDNITEIVRDNLQKTITKNIKSSVAAACFSMLNIKNSKKAQSNRGITLYLHVPDFHKIKGPKSRSVSSISLDCIERNLYGTEFEIILRKELMQRTIAKECAK